MNVVYYNAIRSIGRVPTNQPNSPWLQKSYNKHTQSHKGVINYESSTASEVFMGRDVLKRDPFGINVKPQHA